MPNAGEILDGLGTIANSWQPLAVLWHVYFGAFGASFLLAWRPSKRLVGALLVPPIISVSALAWIAGNPFNGTVFGVLSVVLIFLLRRLKATPAEVASATWFAVGAFLVGFGWVYPHFLDAEPAATYLYAAPLGLVPCPTLSIVVGVAIIFRGLGSLAWSLTLIAAGLFYGAFGALHLGVTIDWVLTGGALSLLGLLAQQASSDEEAIRSAVLGINEHWRAREYNRIGALLAEDAIIAPPGFGDRVRGREAYIQSYRDYDEAAATLEFSLGEPQVDVVGDVAVAVTPFDVVYELQGTRHREKGHDILVFSRLRREWRVVWRTMETGPAGATPAADAG